MENNHIVPDNVKSDYHTFIKWCLQNNIKEIGHTVAPLASSKLRCKPINIEEFSEKIFEEGSELDGSSFSTGGGRVVHRAKVIAKPNKNGKWFVFPDPIRESSLFIMSDMESPQGYAMCARKPLTEAVEYLEKSLDGLMSASGFPKRHPNEKYTLTVGYEKEFFIVPKESESRPDIRYLGQTVAGGYGAINQNLRGVYLTIPKRNEEALLADIVKDLAKVGITAVQKHLEVGQTGNELKGRQCEIVLKYADAVNATDNDLISRQIIEDACDRHGFRALIGSKSFTDDTNGSGINGSGKHTNLSIGKFDSTTKELTENFFETKEFCPTTYHENISVIGLALLAAMGRIWQVLDASISSRGNDMRRRPGFEAPIYLSAFIGNTSEYRDSVSQDRNRSVSIGLSGNKLELRTPGANTVMYYPLAFLSIGVAQVIDEITEAVKKIIANGGTLQEAIDSEYKRLREEVDHFIVSENVYELSKEEAEKRFGCRVPANTPDALTIFDDKEATAFLVKSGIFTEETVKAFKMVQLEQYVQRVIAEAITLANMAKSLSNKTFKSSIMQIAPSSLAEIDPRLKKRQSYLGHLNAELIDLADASYTEDNENRKDLAYLIKSIKGIKDTEKSAEKTTEELLPLMEKTRKVYEKMVEIMGGSEEVAKL